ncbi:MAG: Regulatory sensor-transducer, BlaR1/MecR1 family [Acidobacteria bacterium]|nr:Regulatory sensor-transducer, BlaR1/MecR1 family [Acidobacteriota bacterium]
MNTLLGGPFAQAIGWALLHLLWQGALVAGILAASLALLKNRGANVRYLASCAALVLLVALPVATAWRAYETPLPSSPAPAAAPALAAVTEFLTPSVASDATVDTTWSERGQQFLSGAKTYLPQIVLIWLIGVAFLSLRLLYGWSEAQRLARDGATRASNEWEASLARIADAMQLRRAVTLLESAKVEVPTVIGWLRPIVLLPAATLAGLSREQLEMVLAHELAHIRRHDFFVNLVQAMVETLLFYHPAVWWISRQVRVERENCCDDLAISVCGNALQYARALTRLEELRIDPPSTVLAANGGSLLVRIRRLVASRAESTSGPSRWAAGAALVTVLVALLAMPSMPLFAKHDDTPKAAPAPSTHTSSSTSSKNCNSEARGEIEVHANASPEPDEIDSDSDVEVNADDVTVDIDAPEPPEPPDPPDAPDTPEPAQPAPPAPPAPPAAPSPVAWPHAVALAPLSGLNEAVSEAIAPAVAEAVNAVRVVVPQVRVRVPHVTVTPRAGRRSRTFSSGDKLTVDELIALRSSGITPEYINDMRANSGLGELSLDDLFAMRVQGVTTEYLRALRAAGVTVNSASDAVAMRVQGITGEYVKQLADAGYRHLSPHELIALRVQGVTASFVKTLADAGYTNLSADELARLAASGVNAEFIRDLAQYRSKK